MTGILNQHVKETGIERNRIIIAGFSQGGAMSLALAALSDYKYSAFLVMSGYLPLHNEIADMLRPLNLHSKILMCHGTRDEVVQFNWGKESYNELKNLGFDDVDFKEFDVGHGTNDDEVEYVVEWLKKVTS